MNKLHLSAFACLSALVAAPYAFSQEELIFSDDFSTDTSANWTILNNAPEGATDWSVEFGYDYLDHMGIPASPNSDGTTRGLRMRVNMEGGAVAGITAYPNEQHFSGNYVVKFDLWLNFNGILGPRPPAPGGPGSTQFATFGVGASGEPVQSWPLTALPSEAEGSWFAINGDGGNGWDYRAMVNTVVQASDVPTETEGQYDLPSQYFAAYHDEIDPEWSLRRWSQPYYHSAVPGGATAPQKQIDTYYQNYGHTDPGVPGFMWHEVEILVQDGNVRWTLNGLPIAELDPDRAYSAGGAPLGQPLPTEGNIFVGQFDHNPSVTDNKETLFSLYDNLRVYSLPSAAPGFAQWVVDQNVPEGRRGESDDPDGDGIGNIVEYALGRNPNVADRDGLPVGVPEEFESQQYLTLTINRNEQASGIDLVVEVSSDLVNWESGEGITTVVENTAAQLKVRDNTPITGESRRFIRLSVNTTQ